MPTTAPFGPQTRAFLDLVAWSEGTSSHPETRHDGYDVIVSGVDGLHTFDNFACHPFSLGRAPILVRPGPPPLHSTASGRYQIILPTWLVLADKHRIGSFIPANQDLAALYLLEESGVLAPLLYGDYAEAIERTSNIWASFPGNLFHQGGHSMLTLIDNYKRLLAIAKSQPQR